MPVTSATTEHETSDLGPWRPGIESALPRAYLPLATIYRPENVSTRLEDALELGSFSGLPLQDLAAFRPERLAVHELLIRVMADLSVPVGEKYADLGVNFRRIVTTILSDFITPHAPEISRSFEAVRSEAEALLEREIAAILSPGPAPAPDIRRGSSWRAWLGLGDRAPPPVAPVRESLEERAQRHIAEWRAREAADAGSLAAAAAAALQRVVSAIIRHRGKLIGDAALLRSLACTLVTNDYGSRQIGRLIEPWFHEAAVREGYHALAAQEHPIVMNVKGASASGKSTMRPLQRALAGRIGVQWSDFAVITPDIWRKYLLDYDSLGPARRYAGTLTGHEVEVVDKKLDRYMARKAREGRMSHLLIDRFRFDSFNADASSEDGSQLLTRFGHLVFMLFMITPPDATVERAWKRGEQFGRYKAVDDLLAHNVEAYTGMPRLFFTWALKADKRVHYEFLDNSVPEGERPRTVAFGVNGVMTILDLKFLLDVDRFRKINIDADGPEAVYPDPSQMAPERNTDFLRQCARRMATIRFAEHATGRVYASLDRGRLTCRDGAAYARALADPDVRAAFSAIGGDRLCDEAPPAAASENISRDETETLGAWGDCR
ncbi:DEAD/DEAH box helicase family protein [Methylobacterium planeticum]|uniref:Uncharacterized protein n=1 Tax=Methylobacterium planeticum TaxID=2615211 RepID=A0A6N6MWF5_9HYPH|nr:hypothetical protein [Methylobacterium planeticum]KAB1073359.1 hypothetical protein F6X51_11410 [Methylobacterium planeticum]